FDPGSNMPLFELPETKRYEGELAVPALFWIVAEPCAWSTLFPLIDHAGVPPVAKVSVFTAERYMLTSEPSLMPPAAVVLSGKLKSACGVVVPRPTLPAVSMRILSPEFVRNARAFVAESTPA